MAADKIETVRTLFDRFNSGMREIPEDLVAPEIEFDSPLTQVRGHAYRGYEGGRQWLDDITEQFESWRYEIAEIQEKADSVIATGTVHVEGKASGVELEQRVRWVVGFAGDGRIARMAVTLEG